MTAEKQTKIVGLFECMKCFPRLCRCVCAHGVGLNWPCPDCDRAFVGMEKAKEPQMELF